MRRPLVAAIALCMLFPAASRGLAQTGSPAANPPADPKPETAIDPAKLPVSLDRIRLELADKPATKTSGLKIQETIEVVAPAPKAEQFLWDPETAKLATGPVPYGAPTHKDFINLVTPQEFKNYPMDLNALIQWLLQHLAEKNSKSDGKTPE